MDVSKSAVIKNRMYQQPFRSIIALPGSSANSRFREFSRMASTHSRNKECQKRGTATEHAEMEGPGGRATLHALEHAMGLPRGAATDHAEGGAAILHDMEDAQAD